MSEPSVPDLDGLGPDEIQVGDTLKKVIDGLGPNSLVGLLCAEGKVLYANRASLKTGGLTQSDLTEFLGKPLSQTPWFNHSKEVQDRVQEAVRLGKSGKACRMDMQIRGVGDDELVWVDFSIQPVLDAHGKVSHLVPSALVIQERKIAEANLRANEERLAITLDSIGDAVIATDAKGRVTRMNPTAERLTGWSLELAYGEPLTEVFRIINAKSRKPEKNPVELVMQNGETVGLANGTALIARDGQEYQIADSAAPIRNLQGHIEGVVLVFCDVTERYKIEEELRRTEEKFRKTFDIFPHPVTLNSQDGSLLNCNDAFCQWAGYERSELVGRTAESLGLWVDKSRRDDMLATMRREGFVNEFQAEIRKRSGEVRTVQFSSRMLSTDTEALVLTIANDITELKNVETELRHSKSQLSNALELAKLGPWSFDFPSETFTLTDNFYAIHKTSVEEVGGYSMSQDQYTQRFVPADNAGDVSEQIRRALETNDPLYHGEFESRNYFGDGTIGDFAIRYVVVKDEHGETTAIFGVHQDITQRKAEERARVQLESHLRQSQKLEAIGTLAGGIAHDFNNILTGIYGYIALAQAEIAHNPSLEGYLSEIERGSLRAADLVQQILTFSRGGRSGEEQVPVDFTLVFKEATNLLRAASPTTIKFELTIPTEPLVVKGNATQLHQIIVNLGTNAIYEMGNHPGILSLAVEGCEIGSKDFVRLTISDTGGGIEARTRERIFEPFFTTKSPGEGTGLGLSVVHGIVQSHRGSIQVESELQVGTTFEVLLPAHHSDLEETTEVDPIPQGHGERILIVDDEEMIASVAQRILTRLGYSVVKKTCSLEALALIKADPLAFDLVLSDQTMPEMQGLELAENIRAILSSLPVILTSGFNQRLSEENIKKAGARELLSKPYTVDSLARAVNRHLDPRKRRL